MISKILGGGLVVVGVIAAILGWRLLAAHEELGTHQQALDQATLANQENQTTIVNITTQLNACVAERAVDEQQNQIALANLQTRTVELEARAREAVVVREEIFRDATCEQLGNLDIGALCPAWAAELRQRSSSLSAN
jgi:hypothetical protein